MKLLPMETAPRDEDTDILIFKDMATVTVCHIARWETGESEYPGNDPFEKGWWSYVRGSVTQEKIDEVGTLLGWIPLPDGIDELYDDSGFLMEHNQP
ncbi:MAG: hypothetical protein NXH70_02130 [Hyphomonas sp.]|nr:hypothetical protein [Hyphomonas sp.]